MHWTGYLRYLATSEGIAKPAKFIDCTKGSGDLPHLFASLPSAGWWPLSSFENSLSERFLETGRAPQFVREPHAQSKVALGGATMCALPVTSLI